MNALKGAQRGFELVERGAMLLSGACLFLIMVIVLADVFMRYVFNAPFSWSYDLISQYLLTAAFFLAVSSTFKAGAHISVDFFTQMMSTRLRKISAAIVTLLMMPVLIIMIHAGLDATIQAYLKNEIRFGGLDWPVWLSTVAIPIGMSLLLLRLIIYVAEVVTGKAGSLDDATPQDDGV